MFAGMPGVHCSRRIAWWAGGSVIALPLCPGHGDTMDPFKPLTEHDMNPMPHIDIVALYGQSIHAGGWPKLGWCRVEFDEEA